MDGNEWQLMAMDLKEWQPDAILVSPTGSICLRLTTFPGCEIRRPGRFINVKAVFRNWKKLLEGTVLPALPGDVIAAIVSASLCESRPIGKAKHSFLISERICGDDGESLCERVT